MSRICRYPLAFSALICSLLCLDLVASSGIVRADDWARKMFKETSHDFRTVGRGAVAEHHFEFRNPYKDAVRVASVRTSCGCTTPSVTKNLLAAGEKAAVVAKFNTETHVGQKNATITVVFDKPYYSEVQLKVQGNIRTEVTFDPPEVNFGELSPGQEKVQEILITRVGSDPWKIQDVRSLCTDLAVSIEPPMRTPQGISYKMKVASKKTLPAGDLRERLTLLTSDPRFPTIDMAVSGRVRSGLEVSPASLGLGTVKTGGTVDKKLVIRAEEVFAIRSVKSDDPRFRFEIPAGQKKLHFVQVFFDADQSTGNVSRAIRIETDLDAGKTAECLATVTIEP